MGTSVKCGANYGNLGSLCGSKNDFRMVNMLLITTPDFQFDTALEFADKTKHEEAIKAGKMFVLKGVQEIDDNSVETKYYEAPSGRKTKTKDAVYSFLYKFLLTLEQHKQLQKFDGQDMRYFKVDSSGNIMGWADENGVIRGFAIDTFSTENMILPTGTEAPAFSPLNITEADRNEWNVYGVFVSPLWLTTSLKSLAPVELTVIDVPTATEVKVSVDYMAGINPDGTLNLIAISGLIDTDFVLTKTDGTAQIITGVTELNGVYTLAGASLVSGFVTLADPTNLSDGLLIISSGAVEISI